ncbi:Tryptophan synthase alpha chain [uncultured archaeon]|nr:Tryptophan synthase alpha chain [uncultured archaeon]
MKALRKNGRNLILLTAPTTPDKRLKAVVQKAGGFIYAVSHLGTTGEKKAVNKELPEYVGRIKAAKPKVPVAVGFGVTTPLHVKEVIASGADAAIVGSALVAIIQKNSQSKKKLAEELSDYTKKLKNAAK